MTPDAFAQYPLWSNIAVFLVSAGVVWIAGSQLTVHLDKLAPQLGMGHGFAGMLLLGGVTSLPEIAAISSASWVGNAPLAVSGMLGSISINLVILAVADMRIGQDALSSILADAGTLMQATLGILLLTLVGGACVAKIELEFAGASVWSWLILPSFIACVWLAAGYSRRSPWIPKNKEETGEERSKIKKRKTETDQGIWKLIAMTALAGVLILIAGYLLSAVGDSISQRTGLGASLFGMVLLAFTTGLPEISSVFRALKLGRHEMAMGDIFGTNFWNVAIIAGADFIFEGSIYSAVSTFELFATLLAIMLTGIYMIGLLERKDKTVARMGYDSAAIIVFYLGGLFILYALQ